MREPLQLGLILVALPDQMLLPVQHLLVPLLVHPSVIFDFVELVGQVVQLGLGTDASWAVDGEVD